MTGKVRFGIGFPNRGILFGSTSVAEMFEFARIADGTDGFDSFWVGDSLLSKRRVESMTTGAGWSGDWDTEFKAYHAAPEERLGRMVESIQALRRLWTEPRVTHQGKYWQFENVELLPKPIQNPLPIWIANNVRGDLDSDLVQNALRRVARLADGWQTAVI